MHLRYEEGTAERLKKLLGDFCFKEGALREEVRGDFLECAAGSVMPLWDLVKSGDAKAEPSSSATVSEAPAEAETNTTTKPDEAEKLRMLRNLQRSFWPDQLPQYYLLLCHF